MSKSLEMYNKYKNEIEKKEADYKAQIEEYIELKEYAEKLNKYNETHDVCEEWLKNSDKLNKNLNELEVMLLTRRVYINEASSALENMLHHIVATEGLDFSVNLNK